MKFIPILLGVAIALIGCNTSPTTVVSSTPTTKSSRDLAEIGFSVANPITQGEVKLIPIVSNTPAKPIDQDVITLEVARKNGWVEITESENVDFNAVHVKNTGPKPLLLIAGDLVIGGHQDRVVAHDTIIEPGQEMDVEVFCVEQGRSTGDTDVFTPSSQPVPHKVRREAIFAQDQGTVWGSVDSFNSAAAAKPSTQTVQGGLRSQQVISHVEANTQGLVDKLLEVPNAIGYVLVINGRIDSAEVFGGNRIFKLAAPQLMKSVLAQEATSLTAKGTNDKEADVEKFLYDAMTGRRDESTATSTNLGSVEYTFGVPDRNNRASQNVAPLQRGGRGISRPENFKVSNGSRIRGYEVYSKPKEKGKKLGSLVHGTYANP